MDDRVLVYRGADQPDMSVINPESDVWQHVKVPIFVCLFRLKDKSSLDSSGLLSNELANSLFSNKYGWPTHCRRRKERVGTFQYHVW